MLSPMKAIRMQKGLKQKVVAEQLQIKPAYLSAMENNREPVPEKYVFELAEIYKCHPEELLNGKVMIGRSFST